MDIIKEAYARRDTINKIRPILDSFNLKEIQDFYRIPFIWSSNAIEGNTLTEGETEIILKDGITVAGHPVREIMEAIGNDSAYKLMFDIIRDNKEITLEDILKIHSLCCTGQEDAKGGNLRDRNVIVTGLPISLPRYQDVPKLLDSFITWMKDSKDSLDTISYAAIAHAKLVSIHPFLDGNGRTSRLIMNTVLIKDGFLPVIIPPAYKSEYYEALRLYQTKKASIDVFIEYIAKQEVQTQKDYMRMLHIDMDK